MAKANGIKRTDFDSVDEYISFLENKVQNFEEDYNSLEDELISLQERLQEYIKENKRKDEKIFELKNQIISYHSLRPELKSMAQQINEFKEKMGEKIEKDVNADIVTYDFGEESFRILDEYNVLSDFLENEKASISFIDDEGKIVTAEIKVMEEYAEHFKDDFEEEIISYSHSYIGVELQEKNGLEDYYIRNFDFKYGDQVREFQKNQNMEIKVEDLENENRQLKIENLQLKNELAESKEKINQMVTKAKEIIHNFRENVQTNPQDKSIESKTFNKEKEMELA